MIENTLLAQFRDLYQGNGVPKWDVRIQLAIPKTRASPEEVPRNSNDDLGDGEFFAELDLDSSTDDEEDDEITDDPQE
jgi:hypothetical protein